MFANYLRHYCVFLLLVLLTACNSNPENTSVVFSKETATTDTGDSIISEPITGTVVSIDTMPSPKIVLAGKPEVVPLKNKVFDAGTPEVVTLPQKLTIITPGSDTVPVPEILKAKKTAFRPEYPEQIKALPPRFKDEADCNMKYFGKDQGFNGSTNNKIIQDKNHNIWFASGSLIKYDGTFFTQFGRVFTNRGSFHVCAKYLIEDSRGNIWFLRGGDDKGPKILKYDGLTIQDYSPYNENGKRPLKYLNYIHEDTKGNLWFGGYDNGVYKYEPESRDHPDGRFIHYTEKNGLINNYIKCIAEDHDGNIWFGTNGSGLCKYETGSNQYPYGRFIHYSNREGLSHDVVNCILPDRNNTLWIGTMGGGVNIFDGRSFTHLTRKEGLSSNSINDIHKDKNGDIWIATHGGGICKYEMNPTGKSADRITHFTVEDNLSSNHILSIMEDISGCLWFGSSENYVMIYDGNSFTHLTPNQGMEFDFLRSPIEDREGNIWFGEERGGGLCKFNGETFSYYTTNEGLPGDSITSVIQDESGNIWIGTIGGGLCKYNGRSFTNYTRQNGLSDNHITYLLEDKKGNIWIGTKNGGVCSFDGRSFTQFTKDEGLCDHHVTYILEDSRGNLWFATYAGGADKYNGKHITNYNSDNILNGNKVASLLEDKRESIWIGVGSGGLTMVHTDSTEPLSGFIQFVRELPQGNSTAYYDILSDMNIKFLAEDNNGNIWIGTEKGINMLKLPDDGDPEGIHVNVFKKQDGLKGDNPVINTAMIDSKNQLWHGHNRAFTMLDLNAFNPPGEPPGIQLNNIELEQSFIDYRELSDAREAGELSFIGANNDISLKKVKFTDVAPFYNYPVNLELPYNLNHLTFNFSANDIHNPHKVSYQYKLEGSDRDWRPVTKETRAIYTNLPHSDYTFKVKATGPAGIWSETLKYSFIVHPPWWFSWWAYTLYALCFLALIFAWRRYDLKRQRLKQKLEMEHVQTEKLEELDRMKSHFFANISHEFRTPLTLILGPLQNMLSKANDKQSEKELHIMQRNARRLQRLINQLLNLSKLEAGKMKLQAREENIVKLTRLFVQSFESYATQRNIKLSFTSEKEEIMVYIDREKIEKILNNLLSNAFKFTDDGGRVGVNVSTPPLPPRGGGDSNYLESTYKTLTKHTTNYNHKGDAHTTSPPREGLRGGIVLCVTDTGSGIPPERLQHIFDRFYQADDSYTKDQEGSGIGLALTRELVELHHGNIKVESQPGKGTAFFVYLPMGKSHLKAEEIIEKLNDLDKRFVPDIPELIILPEVQPTFAEDPNMETPDNSIPIVLVVEDNTDLRAYIKGFLDQTYLVVEADDGKNGLAKAIEIIPDLIISDVMMPRMDGYQLCHKLKTDERTSHIPIILLTARASMESRIEGLETGADDFITKPFDPQELQVRVRNLIEQHNKLKERIKKEMGDEAYVPIPILPSVDQQFLDKARKVVHENMAEAEFSVEDFAREVAMSRVQLHRKLRALVDQSTSEFIRTLRLNRAAELLRQNRGNISEIAYDVGFNNPSYFTSNFTKHFGMSPTEYLGKHANK